MEWWHVYLFTRIDSIKTFFEIVSTFGCIAVAIAYFAVFVENLIKQWQAHLVCLVWFICLILNMAIPTSKEIAAIYLVPKLAKSDLAKEAQQIPTDAAKLIRLKLESWIADMDNKKEKEK